MVTLLFLTRERGGSIWKRAGAVETSRKTSVVQKVLKSYRLFAMNGHTDIPNQLRIALRVGYWQHFSPVPPDDRQLAALRSCSSS